jgi:hypothetical protein
LTNPGNAADLHYTGDSEEGLMEIQAYLRTGEPGEVPGCPTEIDSGVGKSLLPAPDVT